MEGTVEETVTVDSKYRLVIPRAVREQLDIEPGTEVTVKHEDGELVIEREPNPDTIISELEEAITEASANRQSTVPGYDDQPPLVQDHADAIRRRAGQSTNNDE